MEDFTFQSGPAQNSVVTLRDTLKGRYICFNVLLIMLEIIGTIFSPIGTTCCCKHYGCRYPELSFSWTENGTASFSSLWHVCLWLPSAVGMLWLVREFLVVRKCIRLMKSNKCNLQLLLWTILANWVFIFSTEWQVWNKQELGRQYLFL